MLTMQTTRPILFVVAAVLMTMMSGAKAVAAPSLAEPPAPQSPHWSHINIFDFGRALYLGAPTSGEQQWLVSHIDAIEGHNNAAQVRGYNPSIALASYQIDTNIFASAAIGLPEEYFLHFSEPTSLTFYSLDKTQVIGTVTIPGCPPGTSLLSSCRVQTYLWNDVRNIYNLASPALQDWLANRIVSSSNAYGADVGANQLVWLDEHAPGFTWPFSFGYQTVINEGGRIRELNEYSATDSADIDLLYNGMVVSWLTYLQQRAASVNKRVLINANNQVLNPLIAAQIKAIHGFDCESYFRPDGFTSPAEFQQFVQSARDAVSGGGWINLHGIWGYTGPPGYTPGNYASSMARYNMWRLAGYYLVKEPVGSLGIVYFDPDLSSNEPPFTLSKDINAWLPAYQVNVGHPIAETTVYQQGSRNGIAHTIFGRMYERAIVLVRPKDCGTCTDYGDTSAAAVDFPAPVQPLLHDGSLDRPTTSVLIRNGEALILFRTGSASSSTGSNALVTRNN
jgi:hypothetical protein